MKRSILIFRIHSNCHACPIVRLLVMKNNSVNNQPRQFETIAGVSDQSSQYVQMKNLIVSRIHNLLSDNGFDLVDYPVLEPTELYVRKSGGGISDRLYSFTDPGGNEVSLRPEFTSSVIRSYLNEFGKLDKIIKRQYNGPVFRYSDLSPGTSLRQFTQQGCEIIGPGQFDTDAEILRLAIDSIASTGTHSLLVRIGNVGAIRELLYSHGLSEAICLFVISNVHNVLKGDASPESISLRATELGLIHLDPSNPVGCNEDSSRSDLINLVESLMAKNLSDNIGRRTTDEIVDRLLEKRGNRISVETFDNALNDLIGFLKNMAGIYDNFISRDNVSLFEKKQRVYLDKLISSVNSNIGRDVEIKYELNFAPERGLLYYTGVLFDISTEINNTQIVLGGGGRYDGLVKSLGGAHDVDAVGFAINVDAVLANS